MKFIQKIKNIQYTWRISRSWYLLMLIAFFLTGISYLKGIQILMFIPAFVGAIFVYSLWELRNISRHIRIEKNFKQRSLQIYIKPGMKYNFILWAQDSYRGQYFLEPREDASYKLKKDQQYDLFLYVFGSFDIFRLRREVGALEISLPWEDMSFQISEKYTENSDLSKLDVLKTSGSDIPYIKNTYIESNSVGKEDTLSLESNNILKTVSTRGLAKYHFIMIGLGALATIIEWESWILNFTMWMTFLWAYLYRNRRNQLSERVKNIFLLLFFVLMFINTALRGDFTGSGSVFLIQILTLIYLFPRDFKNSFLYIFLILFVFVAVSLFSNQIWFIFLFLAYLCVSLYLLFFTSGTESLDISSSRVWNMITSKIFLKVYLSVLLLMGIFFFLLPHGSATESPSFGWDRGFNSFVSGFNEEISLENIRNIKEDRSKILVVENISESDIETLWIEYFRWVRYNYFTGQKWNSDFANRPFGFDNLERDADVSLQINYYPWGRYIFLPAAPVSIDGGGLRLGNIYNDRTILRNFDTINEPTSVEVGFLLWSDGEIIDAVQSTLEVSSEIDQEVQEIFSEYINSIPEDIRDNPQALSNYVQNQSWFSYSTTSISQNISDFLYGTKQWHCEYYATTLAIVLQSFGFNPTFVSWYWYGEYNTLANSYIVRASNAHTWVELYDSENDSWIILDPTPWESLSASQLLNTSLARVIEIYDFMDIKWYTYVVNYTKSEQQKIYSMILQSWNLILVWIILVWWTIYMFRLCFFALKFYTASRRERLLYIITHRSASYEEYMSKLHSHDKKLALKLEQYLYAQKWKMGIKDLISLYKISK